MANSDEPFGFLGFRRDEDGDIVGFSVIPDKDTLDKWKIDPKRPPEVATNEQRLNESLPKQGELSSNAPERITSLLNRFRNSMTSVHSLISFTSAISPAMSQFFIDQKLVVHARKNLTLIEDVSKTIIYALSRDDVAEIRQLFDEFDTDIQGLDALPGATLLSLVATFDSYFSETVRFFLSIHPERYTESDKEIKLKEIFTSCSLEEVVSQVIDNEIVQLMRGSHTEQVRFVEQHLDTKIIDYYERWSNFVEIFERRNLVAHGNLVVNDSYLKNCKSAKYTAIDKIEVGRKLTLTPKYLHKSADILSEFGILLVFVLWRKHIKDSDEDAFRYMSRTCYDLIRTKRSQLAQQLLDFALYKQSRGCSDLIVRMMIVNLANSYKKLNNNIKCQEVISSIDWTASGDRFQVCVAALQGDIEKVVALMPGLAASQALKIHEFRKWPTFDWIRDDPQVNETFERVYGEPMRNKVPEAATIVKTGEVDDVDSKAGGTAPSVEPTRH
jgi:hypothetical protein